MIAREECPRLSKRVASWQLARLHRLSRRTQPAFRKFRPAHLEYRGRDVATWQLFEAAAGAVTLSRIVESRRGAPETPAFCVPIELPDDNSGIAVSSRSRRS